MSETVLTQYTIYAHPRDFPLGFMVRAWHIVRGEEHPQPGKGKGYVSIEAARDSIPEGLVCIARVPDDDPCIVETWT